VAPFLVLLTIWHVFTSLSWFLRNHISPMYGSIVKSFWFLWLMLDIIHINITYFEIPLHRTGLSTSSHYICKWPPHHLGLGDSGGTPAAIASSPPPCSLHLITVRARRGHNPSAGQGWQWRGLTCRASDRGRCRSCYGHRLLLGGEGIEGQGLGGVARASIHCLEVGGGAAFPRSGMGGADLVVGQCDVPALKKDD
jgi:hypothetical protein